MAYLLLLGNIFLMVLGQYFWKMASLSIKGWNAHQLILLFKSPYFIGGVFLYGMATILWIGVLSKLPLSVAYPLQSVSYVLGIILAISIFKETVTAPQWIGVGFILFGVFMIAK